MPHARVRELCSVKKGMDERIDGVLRRFEHVEKMENGVMVYDEKFCVEREITA